MLDTKAVIIQKKILAMNHHITCWEGRHLLATGKWAFFCGHTESWGRPCSKDGELLSLTLTLSR